jgi:amino acid transporter
MLPPMGRADGHSTLYACRISRPDDGDIHMTQVVLVVGAILIGALSILIGARWAATSMSILGTLTMVAIYFSMPHAREIG